MSLKDFKEEGSEEVDEFHTEQECQTDDIEVEEVAIGAFLLGNEGEYETNDAD